MEKHAAANHRLITGLLIFLGLLFLTPGELSAKKYATYEYVRSLSFKKADEYFFTAQECSYYLDIANVSPDNVTVYVNTLPHNVSLVSCKKEVMLPDPDTDDESGTHVVMKLSFSKPGKYKMNAVDVIVNGIFYRLPFESVEVLENPRHLQPQISVVFDDERVPGPRNTISITSGEHIRFTIFIRYAMQITSMYWTVPENSLFKEIQSYDFADGTSVKNEFTTEEFPLASFDWQPLVEGTYTFPDITVVASSYSGSISETGLPNILFKVEQKKNSEEEASEKKQTYAYAFDSTGDEELSVLKEMGLSSVEELHALREKERHSFPFFSEVKNKRQELEKQYELKNEDSETSLPLTITLAVISVLLFACIVLSFTMKKFLFTGISIAAFTGVFVFTTVLMLSCFTQHGIFKGGVLSPVPEENVSASVTLKPGSLVVISQKAASWLYIRHNETYGWIPESDVLIIK